MFVFVLRYIFESICWKVDHLPPLRWIVLFKSAKITATKIPRVRPIIENCFWDDFKQSDPLKNLLIPIRDTSDNYTHETINTLYTCYMFNVQVHSEIIVWINFFGHFMGKKSFASTRIRTKNLIYTYQGPSLLRIASLQVITWPCWQPVLWGALQRSQKHYFSLYIP